MNKGLRKKWALPWIKYILAAMIVMLVFLLPTAAWLFPHSNWSLNHKSQIEFVEKNVSQTGFPLQDIRSVVLVSIDTCRADHLSCYGYSRKTSPNIDAVAAEGVRFNHCISPVPLTLPSHSSMLTGTIPLRHKVRDNNIYRLDRSNTTLAEILRDNGFATAAVVGAFVMDSQFGLDQGFDTYDDSLKGKENKAQIFYNERSAAEVSRLANAWLEEHTSEKFFLFLHYFDPHAPYLKHNRFTLPLKKHYYDDEIAYTDYHFGRVIKKLKELGLYDSALLIITSDHGESLKEHSENSHGFFIYHSTLHVPLIIKVPGGPKGLINDVVGLIDIVPTVCGFLGIAAPIAVQGKDLSPYFLKERPDENKNDRFLYCESLMPTKFDAGPLLGLASNRWKYIHSSEPELYDLAKDCGEVKNLLNQQKQQAGIMQDELKSILRDNNLSTIAVNKVVLEDETRRRLESLGYIAGKTVNEDVGFEQKKSAPKKLVEVNNVFEKILTYMGDRKFNKAKKACKEMLKRWPDMKLPHLQLGQIALYEQDTQAIIHHFSTYLAYEDTDLDDSDMLRVRSDYANAHNNLGVALSDEGKTYQAIKHYKKALSYDPYYVKANYNLSNIYLRQGKLTDAVTYCKRALDLDPEMPEANYLMGYIRLKQKRFDKAIVYFNKALEMTPDSQQTQDSLRTAKRQMGKVIIFQLESLSRDPNQPQLHNNLANLFRQQGNIEKALYHWHKVQELEPDKPEVLNNLAWILATTEESSLRNPGDAVRFSERACELTQYRRPDFLDTLAVAYAAAGRFDIAVKTAEKALVFAQAANMRHLANEIKTRLKLYKRGQPFFNSAKSPQSTISNQ